MVALNLEPLLNPSSVAVVGASPGKTPGGNVIQNLVRNGFTGLIYPVNPKYHEVAGYPCYPDLGTIPGEIDCLVLASPAGTVPALLEEGMQKGIKAAIIVSSGFGEAGGDSGLERRLQTLAWGACLPVTGPNCLGVINLVRGKAVFAGSYAHTLSGGAARGVAMVSQSGGVLLSTLYLGLTRRLPFTYLITSGNETVLRAQDYLEYLLRDQATRVLAVVVEGFKEGRRFLEVAREARRQGKPVVVMKLGSSARGSQGALAHTGSLSGSDQVCDAAFRQEGIIRVQSMDQMVETSLCLLKLPPPSSPGVGAIAVSGGTCALVADLCERLGLELPDLSPEARRALAQILPEFGAVHNPLDLTLQGLYDRELLGKVLRILAGETALGTLVVILPLDKGGGSANLQAVVQQVDTLAGSLGKPLAVISTVSEGLSGYWQEFTARSQVPFLQDIEGGLKALRQAVSFHCQGVEEGPALPLQLPPPSRQAGLPASRGRVLNEYESKLLLRGYGISVTREGLATTPEEAVRWARKIGYPVALKVVSPDILHKTERRGVVLNVVRDEEVLAAYHDLLANVRAATGEVMVEGVLVQEMVPGGVEVIVGLQNDPAFGPTLLFGPGGILVELVKDTALRVLPVNRAALRGMVEESRAFPLLRGFRGGVNHDLEGLLDLLERFCALCLDLRQDVQAIDLNPVKVLPVGQGVKVLDALILKA